MRPAPYCAYDEPDQLRAGIEENLVTLGLERLAAVNLRIMDGSRPGRRFDAQLAALIQARREGLIDGIGLSNITTEHLRRAVDQSRDRLRAEPVQSRRSTLARPPSRMRLARHRLRAVLPPGLAPRRPERHPHESRRRRPRRAAGGDSGANRTRLAARPLAQRPAHPRHPDPPASHREHPIRQRSESTTPPEPNWRSNFPPFGRS